MTAKILQSYYIMALLASSSKPSVDRMVLCDNLSSSNSWMLKTMDYIFRKYMYIVSYFGSFKKKMPTFHFITHFTSDQLLVFTWGNSQCIIILSSQMY